MIKKKYKIVCVMLGILAVLSLYLTWCVSTISYMGKIYEIVHILSTCITSMLYIGCVLIVKKYWDCDRLKNQIQILNICILILFVIITITDISRGDNSIFLWISDGIWIIAAEIVCCLLPCNIIEIIKKIIICIKKNWWMVPILIIAVILAIYPTMGQFKWDGALYEQACRRMNIHSMSSMAAYAHIAQGYGVLVCLCRMIIDEPEVAMALCNIVMYVLSIIAFYGSLRHLKKDLKIQSYIIATCVYAFSPFLLGMVNYYSLDYATLCIFICMFFFLLKKQWIFHFMFALLVCFTKEPAIVSYGGLCVGVVISDMILDTGNVMQRIKNVLCRVQYYLMALVGILWLVTYALLGGWSAGEGGTALDYVYIFNKLKVLFLLNFNWIFTVVIIVMLILMILRKSYKDSLSWSLPLLISLLLFTCFSMMFKTVNHARYAANSPAILYLLAIVLMYKILKEKYVQIFLGIVTVLMLGSSFRTIDPVSLFCFENVDVGNKQMITTGRASYGDSMIYNKEMLGMEYAFNKALEYAIENECNIYVPTVDNRTYYFDGFMMSEEQDEKIIKVNFWWDADRNKRIAYENDEASLFTMYELKENVDLNDLERSSNETKCYIYSDLVGKETAEQILEEQDESSELEFVYDNWVIKMVLFQ